MPQALPTRAASATRYAYAAAVLVASWYAMMAIHELGHVAAAWATGGAVERIVLPLFGFSRTDVTPNPHPLTVAWAGPIASAALPLTLWLIASATLPVRFHAAAQTLRFFAGFCLLANGVYLGLGWIDHVGDTGDLRRLGTPTWQLVAFGITCTAVSLHLWHGLGPRLGLRSPPTTSPQPPA